MQIVKMPVMCNNCFQVELKEGFNALAPVGLGKAWVEVCPSCYEIENNRMVQRLDRSLFWYRVRVCILVAAGVVASLVISYKYGLWQAA